MTFMIFQRVTPEAADAGTGMTGMSERALIGHGQTRKEPAAMDLMFSEEDLAFREEVRTFIRENLPADIAEATRRASSYVPKEFSVRWHKILH
jgi:hypothetical protein